MLNLIRPLMGVMGYVSRPLIESISEVTRNGRGYGQYVGYIFHHMFIEGGEDGGNIMDIWCKKNINILFT